MRIWVSNGSLSNSEFNVPLEEPFVIDYEFLLSHLKTGYPKEYQNLTRYKRNFNRLSKEVLQYYLDLLEKWRNSVQLQFNYPGMIFAISDAFRISFDLGRPVQEAVTEYADVRVGSTKMGTNSTHDAEIICTSINDLFRERYDDMKNFWEAEQTAIITAFKRIENLVRAGLPIKGHCSAGQIAGYE